ncbi:MAG: 2-C-methyl-D-erythritol 4-phosphate cytidylyltransferase [Bacteroidales bacterium]
MDTGAENRYMIIVAGGMGQRMGAPVPKQFVTVAGRPLLMHTLDNLHRIDPEMELTLVLPEPFVDFWQSLCHRNGFQVKHEIVSGGETRFDSVKNGLARLPDSGLTGVHDGVRPLVTKRVVDKLFAAAAKSGAAIPVVKVNESLRELDEEGNHKPADRKRFRVVQTPQVFSNEILKEAYKLPNRDSFTDDASVVEAAGYKITLIDGNTENIKVTRPADLKIAAAFLDTPTS